MTSHQRYARACTLAAVLLAAGAITLSIQRHHLPAAALAYGTTVLAWAAAREHQAHRRVLAEHEWARRRALGENPPPLDPCCHLWQRSGTVHAPNCTRDRFEQQIADFYDDPQDGAA